MESRLNERKNGQGKSKMGRDFSKEEIKRKKRKNKEEKNEIKTKSTAQYHSVGTQTTYWMLRVEQERKKSI